MTIYDIITKKKMGGELSDEEIELFVSGFTRGEIFDFQASALLMAICIRGMSDRESLTLTRAIAESGKTLDLSRFSGRTVDKHSSGGVGDKTTLVVAPLVASLGCPVAKMSGRGLGHTGGTIDKLESIPGFCAELSPEELVAAVEHFGIAVTAQSANLAPADGELYALRDVTATVDSIPLIASSIMGKKLAAGADSIVLDVKFGSGAFMKTQESARELATLMVSIGRGAGRRVRALVTDMSTPLGYAVGNAAEVNEAVSVLSGRGPADLTALCTALASNMVSLSRGISVNEAEKLVQEALSSGKALSKFNEWIRSQGGNTDFIGEGGLPLSKYEKRIFSTKSGYIYSTDTEAIGRAAAALGAGRLKKGDIIDCGAAIILSKKRGDFVERGELLATLYASNEELFSEAERIFCTAHSFSDTAPKAAPIIADIIG